MKYYLLLNFITIYGTIIFTALGVIGSILKLLKWTTLSWWIITTPFWIGYPIVIIAVIITIKLMSDGYHDSL